MASALQTMDVDRIVVVAMTDRVLLGDPERTEQLHREADRIFRRAWIIDRILLGALAVTVVVILIGMLR